LKDQNQELENNQISQDNQEDQNIEVKALKIKIAGLENEKQSLENKIQKLESQMEEESKAITPNVQYSPESSEEVELLNGKILELEQKLQTKVCNRKSHSYPKAKSLH
jgi:hypothetical protein